MKDEKVCATCEYNTQNQIIPVDKSGFYEIKSKCYTCWNNGEKRNFKERGSVNENEDR